MKVPSVFYLLFCFGFLSFWTFILLELNIFYFRNLKFFENRVMAPVLRKSCEVLCEFLRILCENLFVVRNSFEVFERFWRKMGRHRIENWVYDLLCFEVSDFNENWEGIVANFEELLKEKSILRLFSVIWTKCEKVSLRIFWRKIESFAKKFEFCDVCCILRS